MGGSGCFQPSVLVVKWNLPNSSKDWCDTLCVCGGSKYPYLLNEMGVLYVWAWPCAYIYHKSRNWWGVMINDVVDEMHPATIITKHVHKHIQLWNSERWWSFGDIVIARRVHVGVEWLPLTEGPCYTSFMASVMWCLWKTHVVWSMGKKIWQLK